MNSWTLLAMTIVAAGPLLWLGRAARGTTLMYAWGWACLAAAGVAGVELAIMLPGGLAESPDTARPARYLAAILVFCPLMSALGSKRPHDQAWQWIVLSLWGILALPAFEWLALRRSPALEISGVRAWFLVLLVGMTALHWLGTRLTLAGLMLAAAQACALWEWLPLGGAAIEPWVGLSLWVGALAAGAASFGMPGGSAPGGSARSAATTTSVTPRVAAGREPCAGDLPPTPASTATPPPDGQCWAAQDRVWRDFRDRFGTLWAFRIMERVNTAAILAGWPVRLEWNGFQTSPLDAAPSRTAMTVDEQDIGVDQALWNLLRRFVSSDWCQARGWTPPA
jgi:hypothetical protein